MRNTIWLLAILAGSTQATLEPRLGGVAVYDSDINVTWFSDADLAGRRMDQGEARSYLASLNAQDFLGVDTWRGPGALAGRERCVPDAFWGEVCIAAELQHLYYDELGGTGTQVSPDGFGFVGDNLTGSHGPFHNIQSGYFLILPEEEGPIGVMSFAAGGFTTVAEDQDDRLRLWVATSGDPFGITEPPLAAALLASLLFVLWHGKRNR